MSAELLLILTLAAPLAAAVLIPWLERQPKAREAVALLAGLVLLVCVLVLVPTVVAGARPQVTLVEMLPGLSLRLAAEPLGLLFAMVAAVLWPITSLYSIGYLRAEGASHQGRFYTYFAIALASTMGVAFAGNLLTLLVFYEVLTLSTYPLVTHHGNAQAMRGGRSYIGILLTTSIALLLPAIVGTYYVTGTLAFTPGGILAGHAGPGVAGALLVLYVLGIGKAAVMPVHRWLPAAMVAPTPVSALLHAVAVVKAGVFTVLKVSIYLFGSETLASIAASTWLAYLAAATILIASLIALGQDNLKARLAYSTISQLSYIVLGAMLANPAGLLGGGLHIVMHAFAKITLFFCSGAILIAAHKTEISDMPGLGRRMPFTMAAFFIASLGIIGLPLGGGLWSKWYLALGTLDAHQPWLLAVLMLSSLLSAAYLLPIPVRAFFSAPAAADRRDGWQEAPAACLAAMALTTLGSVVLFFYPGPVIALLQPLVTP